MCHKPAINNGIDIYNYPLSIGVKYFISQGTLISSSGLLAILGREMCSR